MFLGWKELNIKKVIPYVIIALLGVIVFLIPLGSEDELWNYNFAKNISLGHLPYRDFSMVPTPLSACFPAQFMLLFGRGLIVFRIAGYFLFVLIFSLLYCVCNLIHEDTIASMMHSLFAMALLVLVYQYDYNHLMILLLFLIYLMLLKGNGKFCFWGIGLVSGLAILIKQNTGLAVMAVNAVVCLWNIVKGKEKRQYFIRLLASLIPGVVFLLYLVVSQTLDDFWEYAVYGVSTFKQRMSLIDQLRDHWMIGAAIIFLGCWVVITGIRCLQDKENIKGRELFLYALAGMTVVYPLCDAPHLIAGIIPVIPAFSMFARKRLKGNARLAVITAVICICVLSFYEKAPIRGEKMSDLPNYEGIFIRSDLSELLRVVYDYVVQKESEGYKVRIADQSAAFFTIPLNTYEKNWDMLNVGNFGANAVEDLLGEDHNYLYLVYGNEEDLGSQSHLELIHHIKNNYKKIDEVLCFEVYESTN